MIPSNSSSTGLGQTGASTGQGKHRSLDEDVLQSAEDAVASEGADDYGLSRGDHVTRAGGVESAYTGTVGSSGSSGMNRLDLDEEGHGFFSRMESQVTRYVAQQPAKAAMMAAGAGALLAILMGRRGKDRH